MNDVKNFSKLPLFSHPPPVEIIIKNLACILDLFPKYLSTICVQVHVNGLHKQNHYELFSLLFAPVTKVSWRFFHFVLGGLSHSFSWLCTIP